MGEPQEISKKPSCEPESEELRSLEHAPPFWRNPKGKKRLSKQLSMRETPGRNMDWEKRRRRQERRKNGLINPSETAGDLTDEDLNELKGCIELGFGFNEEEGQRLCTTLPALDLYFAVNRQLPTSPGSTPPCSPTPDSDSWKICSPGDDPQHVKMKLRHWAQAVACSVMQSY